MKNLNQVIDIDGFLKGKESEIGDIAMQGIKDIISTGKEGEEELKNKLRRKEIDKKTYKLALKGLRDFIQQEIDLLLDDNRDIKAQLRNKVNQMFEEPLTQKH